MQSNRHHSDSYRAHDGVLLYEQRWVPDGPASAIVAVVHGFGEHGGRYAQHARRLTAKGFHVEAMDLRGHGNSGGPHGQIGSWSLLVDDLVEFLARVRSRPGQGELPLFLFGHSFGATLAGLTAIRIPQRLRGLVLCSPALQLGEPSWLQRLALSASRIAPMLPTKRLNRSLLSTDPLVVRGSEEDPLNFHGFIRVGSAAQMIRAGRQLMNSGSDLHLPLLIIHGTEDHLTLPVASAQLYRRSVSTNKALSLFKGMRHETFNEPDGHQVIDRIIDFILEQCADSEYA